MDAEKWEPEVAEESVRMAAVLLGTTQVWGSGCKLHVWARTLKS